MVRKQPSSSLKISKLLLKPFQEKRKDASTVGDLPLLSKFLPWNFSLLTLDKVLLKIPLFRFLLKFSLFFLKIFLFFSRSRSAHLSWEISFS